jgi:hydroxymethylpyrimidine pyrophosphatase-like HAD family hydrolase
MPNDLPMIEWAGRGIAVANAHPDVIAAADQVAPSNDDDGVAVTAEPLLGSRDGVSSTADRHGQWPP